MKTGFYIIHLRQDAKTSLNFILNSAIDLPPLLIIACPQSIRNNQAISDLGRLPLVFSTKRN